MIIDSYPETPDQLLAVLRGDSAAVISWSDLAAWPVLQRLGDMDLIAEDATARVWIMDTTTASTDEHGVFDMPGGQVAGRYEARTALGWTSTDLIYTTDPIQEGSP